MTIQSEPIQTLSACIAYDPAGQAVPLSRIVGRQPLVLFFYPKDFTPGCTSQVCGFRDAYQDFMDAGPAVIGVSSDSEDSHRRFVETHRLPFPLVADADDRLRKAFGVPKTLGLLPGRVTYVIDTQGQIRDSFNSQLDIDGHIRKALGSVRQLA